MQLPSESAVTLRDDWGVNDLIAYLCRSQRRLGAADVFLETERKDCCRVQSRGA